VCPTSAAMDYCARRQVIVCVSPPKTRSQATVTNHTCLPRRVFGCLAAPRAEPEFEREPASPSRARDADGGEAVAISSIDTREPFVENRLNARRALQSSRK